MEADEKTCPFCAETIKAAAVVCKHCGRDQPKQRTADDELMDKHGITMQEDRFVWRGNFFRSLDEAIAYAERKPETAPPVQREHRPAAQTSGGMTFLRVSLLLFLFWYSFAMGQSAPYELNSFGKLVAGLFFVFAPALYLLPCYEAYRRNHPKLAGVAVLNILLGWTILGWVGALVWSVSQSSPPQR